MNPTTTVLILVAILTGSITGLGDRETLHEEVPTRADHTGGSTPKGIGGETAHGNRSAAVPYCVLYSMLDQDRDGVLSRLEMAETPHTLRKPIRMVTAS